LTEDKPSKSSNRHSRLPAEILTRHLPTGSITTELTCLVKPSNCYLKCWCFGKAGNTTVVHEGTNKQQFINLHFLYLHCKSYSHNIPTNTHEYTNFLYMLMKCSLSHNHCLAKSHNTTAKATPIFICTYSLFLF
jgi:hypothetical protein